MSSRRMAVSEARRRVRVKTTAFNPIFSSTFCIPTEAVFEAEGDREGVFEGVRVLVRVLVDVKVASRVDAEDTD